MNSILQKSKWFQLTEKRRRKNNNSVYYEIKIDRWGFDNDGEWLEAVRDIIDPLRNKSGKYGIHWNFRDRDEAEKMMSMLLLKE